MVSGKGYLKFLVGGLLLAAVASCGTVSKTKVGSRQAVSYPPLDHNASQRFKYFYLEAAKQHELHNYAAGFDLLNHCLEINPNAAEVYFARSEYQAALNNLPGAMADVEKAVELNPSNQAYQEYLAQGYIAVGQIDDAIRAYEQLFEHDKDRDDVLNILIQLYGREKDYDHVLSTLDRLEQLNGISEEITLSRMRVFSLKGDKKAELKALQTLSEKHPNDMNYHVMVGNWLLQNDSPEKALEEYQYVLNMEPENLIAQMSMLDYYRTVGQDSLASELQEKILVSENTPANSKIALMRKVVNDNEQDGGDASEVYDLFHRILAKPQKTSDMYELYAMYLMLKEMPKDSINNALMGALSVAPDNAGVRLQLLQSKWEEKDYDAVIELSKPALEYNPDEMVFYYFLGVGYFYKEDRDGALSAFQRGVSQINENSNRDIVSDFYAMMGEILHDKNREQEAYAAYDSCLQWKPDNIGCLNNYAYYLSEQGRELQKAEQMSYRTIKAEPENSTYLDTYAWILFMEERYEESKTYIDKAVENDSTSSDVILEHAGDIYAKLGETDKAVEYWQKSLDAGNESKVLIRKIKIRKYLKK